MEMKMEEKHMKQLMMVQSEVINMYQHIGKVESLGSFNKDNVVNTLITMAELLDQIGSEIRELNK